MILSIIIANKNGKQMKQQRIYIQCNVCIQCILYLVKYVQIYKLQSDHINGKLWPVMLYSMFLREKTF